MKTKPDSFNRAVSALRKVIVKRVDTNKQVSALDVSGVASKVEGSVRGAAVRTAFTQLVAEKVIQPTKLRVYNPETHHSVMIYSSAK